MTITKMIDDLHKEAWEFYSYSSYGDSAFEVRLIKYGRYTRATKRHKWVPDGKEVCWSRDNNREYWNGNGLKREDVPLCDEDLIRAEIVKRTKIVQ